MESSEHTGYRNGKGVSRILQDLQQNLQARPMDKATFADQPQHSDKLRNSVMKSGEAPHVGIVGAGFAGLRCADVLLQNGCKVTIFEARNRVGGRVAQSNHLGHPVDL